MKAYPQFVPTPGTARHVFCGFRGRHSSMLDAREMPYFGGML